MHGTVLLTVLGADPAVIDRSQRLFGRMFGGPQKDTKVMTGSQSVVPEGPYHRAAQHGRMSYRLLSVGRAGVWALTVRDMVRIFVLYTHGSR